jgi:outer membrane protein assembly factor BamB
MRLGIVLLFGAGLVCPLRAENWPGWRGPRGNGHSAEKQVPLRWSPTENVRWKVALPAPGNSSPIVWGDRVFITQANKSGDTRSLLCFERTEGKKLWQADVTFEGKEDTHQTNPYCSATPVTDGERIVVSHGSAGMHCYDFAGKERWHKDLGKLQHIWGNASSPILYDNLAILWCGPGERQFLLAVDKKTGKEVWRHDEPGGSSGKNKPWIGSWSTPIVVKVQGREELILSVPEKVKGFDPKTGKELWSCSGLGKLVYTSPACSEDGIVISLAGYGGPGLAVRAGGNGDVTATHRLWHHAKRNPQRIGSPLIIGSRAYLINEPGQGSCFDLPTGKDLWKQQRTTSRTWGSLVYAAGRLYVTNVGGETIVLEPGPTPKILARNRLGETVRASLAVSEGEFFLRSYNHLWCISDKK